MLLIGTCAMVLRDLNLQNIVGSSTRNGPFRVGLAVLVYAERVI